MRLHLGAPRHPLFAVLGRPTFTESQISFAREIGAPVREISAMYGVSWGTGTGFVFIGVQRHEKQQGEN